MKLSHSIHAVAFLVLVIISPASPASASNSATARPAFRVELETILTGRGHQFFSQSRAALIPGNPSNVILTTQETDPTVTYGYKDLFHLISRDGGWTWSPPTRIESLRRTRLPAGYDFVIGDVYPQWHAATGVVLATGKTFGFLGGTKEDCGLERVSYATYTPATDR